MRLFSLLDFQYFILAFFLGLISVLLVYLGFKGWLSQAKEEMEEGEVHFKYADELREAKHPIPPLLLFVYIGVVVWAVAYAILMGIFGGGI
jgi:hypothetical protein